MARFTDVVVYPPTGRPDRLMNWHGSTPTKDAFLRASSPACELYSQCLRALGVDGFKSKLLLTPWFPED